MSEFLPALTSSEWMKVTAVGVEVLRPPSFDEYEADFQMWLIADWASPIVLGDLMNLGESLWPEEYVQVIDAYTQSHSAQTLANYKSVMKAVPPAVRRAGLRYNHYDAVRTLPVKDQDAVLKVVSEKGLGTEDTRILVRKVKEGNGQPVAPLRLRMQCAKVIQEFREGKLVYVLCEPVFIEGEALPQGEVEVSIREIV